MKKTYTIVRVKEYVDSIEKFIFYDHMIMSKSGCMIKNEVFSDSVYDSRTKKIISRQNKADDYIYKISCNKDTLFKINPLYKFFNDTFLEVNSTQIVFKNKKIRIRRYEISDTFLLKKNIVGAIFYTDEYGILETALYKPDNSKMLRIRIESASFFNNDELNLLQQGLRKDSIYK